MDKRGAMFAALICFLFVAFPAIAEVHWLKLDEGLKMGVSQHKPVIVDFFYGKGCPRCEFLQTKVYDNAAIGKKISDNFVPVRVDLSKKLSADETAFGNRFDFKNDCLLLFLDHNGKLIKGPGGKKLSFVDSLEPEQFMKHLDFIMEGYK